jgi:putative transcriptional regulator
MTGSDIRALRLRLGLTQAAFAARYQLPERTMQNYEQGRDTPPAGMSTLLRAIDIEPETIARILENKPQALRSWVCSRCGNFGAV